MKIADVQVVPVALPLRRPLATAHGVISRRAGVLLRLTAEDGTRGWGETFPLASFRMEPAQEAAARLASHAERVHGRAVADWRALLDEAEERLSAAPGARAALDLALHDLVARTRGVRVAELLADGPVRRSVEVSALLAADSPEALAREGRAAVSAGFGTLKLKLTASLDREAARLAALRAAVGPAVTLRCDANGGIPAPQARAALALLARHGVALLEEPVAGATASDLASLRGATPVAVAADESISDAAAAEKLLQAGAIDALVLKPGALGGLREAGRIAARAREAGVVVIVTSLLDSTLGVTAALHFTAALPPPLPPAGLATAHLLAADLAAAPAPRGGRLHVPEGPGLGVAPDPEALAALRTDE